jgi:hypothetical protein
MYAAGLGALWAKWILWVGSVTEFNGATTTSTVITAMLFEPAILCREIRGADYAWEKTLDNSAGGVGDSYATSQKHHNLASRKANSTHLYLAPVFGDNQCCHVQTTIPN